MFVSFVMDSVTLTQQQQVSQHSCVSYTASLAGTAGLCLCHTAASLSGTVRLCLCHTAACLAGTVRLCLCHTAAPLSCTVGLCSCHTAATLSGHSWSMIMSRFLFIGHSWSVLPSHYLFIGHSWSVLVSHYLFIGHSWSVIVSCFLFIGYNWSVIVSPEEKIREGVGSHWASCDTLTVLSAVKSCCPSLTQENCRLSALTLNSAFCSQVLLSITDTRELSIVSSDT